MADSDSASPSSDSNPPSSSPKLNQPSLSSDPNPPSSSSEPNPSSSDANPSSSPSPSTSNSHSVSILAQATFIDSLPARIRSEHQEQLDRLFDFYVDRFITTAELELHVLRLIKNVPGAVNAFKKLLPTSNLIPAQSKKGRTVFIREICNFNDRVRAGLYDDIDNYMSWLKHLTEFKNGNESFEEFKKNVEAHFANMADLWMEFDAKFGIRHDDLDPEESNQDSTSAGMPSDSSDQEPTSKRPKTK